MIKFFLLLCSLEAEEVATHGAPEAWKEARERVDETFQVFFHTFVSPAQYILYLIQLNCTKVNDDVIMSMKIMMTMMMMVMVGWIDNL